MTMISDDERMKRSYRAIDDTNMDDAYELIQPMLVAGDSEAEYIYAIYISHQNETAKNFDLRSLRFIKKSVGNMYPLPYMG